MPDQPSFPFRVDYLDNLALVKNISGSEIRDLALRMMQRLSETKTPHKWSHAPDVFPIPFKENDVYYSRYIYFAHKEDELAFRLTWGIHTHYE